MCDWQVSTRILAKNPTLWHFLQRDGLVRKAQLQHLSSMNLLVPHFSGSCAMEATLTKNSSPQSFTDKQPLRKPQHNVEPTSPASPPSRDTDMVPPCGQLLKDATRPYLHMGPTFLGRGRWGRVWTDGQWAWKSVSLKTSDCPLSPLRELVWLHAWPGASDYLLQAVGPSQIIFSRGHIVRLLHRLPLAHHTWSHPHPFSSWKELCVGLLNLWTTLEALHSEGYVHGDIKPDNLLVMEDGTARLADWTSATHRSWKSDNTGTLLWRCPDTDLQTPEADMWATGMVLLDLLSPHRPVTHDLAHQCCGSDWMHAVRRTWTAAKNSQTMGFSLTPENWTDLEYTVHSLLNLNPQARPTARDMRCRWSQILTSLRGSAFFENNSDLTTFNNLRGPTSLNNGSDLTPLDKTNINLSRTPWEPSYWLKLCQKQLCHQGAQFDPQKLWSAVNLWCDFLHGRTTLNEAHQLAAVYHMLVWAGWVE